MAESIATAEQLAAAREARGLSVDDITRQLKLAPRQVLAVERGEWSALPGLAFVRGVLRGYGRILDVDVEPLVQSVASTVHAADLRPAASLDQPLPRQSMFGFASGGSGSRLAWVGLAVLALIVLALFLGGGDNLQDIRSWLGRSSAEAEGAGPAGETAATQEGKGTTIESVALPTLPQAASEPGATAPTAGGSASAASGGVADSPARAPADAVRTGTSQADASQKGAAPATATATEPGKSPAAGATRAVKVAFSRDAWIEVRDLQGRVLFAGMQRASSVREFPMAGPISLVIGNAESVTVELDGKPVDLAPHTRATVARLSLR